MRRTPLRRRSKEPPTHRPALGPAAYARLRAHVAHRAGFRCEHPACRSAKPPLDLHHVVKRAQGGADHPDNCVYLCRRVCHPHTDAPYAQGRLVIESMGGERFRFAVVTKPDQFAPDPPDVVWTTVEPTP